MIKSLFNKVAGLKACNFIKKAYNFIKKRLQHRRFPVNITTFLKKVILKNIREWLLLPLIFVKSLKTETFGNNKNA